MSKIKKILIANRGEIACRVMKTARKMGIQTVAVYSDADAKALHTRMADEAVDIGPSPAAESYLVIDKIIDACKQTGADAVHPGYGFLSENPEFARRLKKEGITFIGPAAESMEAMGLKDAAKKLMDEAGVPITPGYHGKDQDPKLLEAKAGMIGYPVLIKAVAGGGGKGMRKVEAAKDFKDMLSSCQREAKSSFGNDDVLIEKYIQSPRHIEVQVFGDTHGNVVHMFERDCSLQRRHQKVIEEAPAPGMTDIVRKAMTDAAVQAAKAANYVGAGTVEFIVDGSGTLRPDGFWFMEMNTRLQVEHPVTEMITGLDLVELQIRVAQGEELPKQSKIEMEGHAIEARLYAEDPANDFLPSIGKIDGFDPDVRSYGFDEYRVDTGVEQGDRVTIFYDPMIAKVVALSETREEAISSLKYVLKQAGVIGLTTNSGFLYRCLDHEKFVDGHINTNFIPENIDNLIPDDFLQRDEVYALAALFFEEEANRAEQTPFTSHDGWRLNQSPRAAYLFEREGELVEVRILDRTSFVVKVSVNRNDPISISLHQEDESLSNEEVLLDYNAWAYSIFDDNVSLYRNTQSVCLKRYIVSDEASNQTSDDIAAPMPGKIIAVNVKPGDTVKAGDPVIVMEAMKMEMTLEAPRDGVVADITAAPNALVSDGEVLLTLEEE